LREKKPVPVWQAAIYPPKRSPALFRNNPGGAGSAGGKRPGESAYTASSGFLVCIRGFVYFGDQRDYQDQRAGRFSPAHLTF